MKAVLVDDDIFSLTYLEDQLLSLDSNILIQKYKDPLKAKDFILQNDIDVIFLDIQLPIINGILLAQQIKDQKPKIPIIFTTSHRGYAVQAFEVNALDYLVKPFQIDRLSITFDRIQETQKLIRKTNYLSYYNSDKILYLKLFNQIVLKKGNGTEFKLSWRTKKTAELFLYLLQNHGQCISKELLTDVLWPDSSIDRANSYLYTAIYHIRKTIIKMKIQEHFYLKSSAEGYILTLKNVSLDTVEFLNSLKNIKKISNETLPHYQSTLSIYSGSYLAEYNFWWVEAEREKFKRCWRWGYYQLANYYYQNGSTKEALLSFLYINDLYPEEEEACLKLMQIYEESGNSSLVEEHYGKYKKFMLDELNLETSTIITSWFNDFLKRKKLNNKKGERNTKKDN